MESKGGSVACCPDSTPVEQPPLFSVLDESNNVCGEGERGRERREDSKIDREQGPVARAPTEMKAEKG